MSKCFDDFKELMDDMNEKRVTGKMDVKDMECAYMSVCAGYLAYIIDKLDEITSKLEEKEKNEKNRFIRTIQEDI